MLKKTYMYYAKYCSYEVTIKTGQVQAQAQAQAKEFCVRDNDRKNKHIQAQERTILLMYM